jgi:hypothetical protein
MGRGVDLLNRSLPRRSRLFSGQRC